MKIKIAKIAEIAFLLYIEYEQTSVKSSRENLSLSVK